MKSCPRCQATYPGHFTVCPQDATPLVELGAWAEGAVVRGKYRVLCKIGQGGMGAVYKAQHVRFDELRALKVISPELASDPSFVKRFIHEAVITRKLHHPNAVLVDDVDEAEDGRPFIVMEFMEGRSLKSLIRQEGPLPAATVGAIIKQAAGALGAAHTLGMVHRDIKPDNIYLVERPEGEQAKVLDFGIAKVKEAGLDPASGVTLTKTGMIVGTPQYMSPEQAMGMRGDELDGRSDLYSLGVVMYEMLSGEVPFHADSTMKILMAQIHEPPPPLAVAHPELEIPDAIVGVVMRLLEKKRENRPATAAALIQEIDSALESTAAPLAPTRIATPAGMEPWSAVERPSAQSTSIPPRGVSRPIEPGSEPRNVHSRAAAAVAAPLAVTHATSEPDPNPHLQQKALRTFVGARLIACALYILALMSISTETPLGECLIFASSLMGSSVLLWKVWVRGGEGVRSYLRARFVLLYLLSDVLGALLVAAGFLVAYMRLWPGPDDIFSICFIIVGWLCVAGLLFVMPVYQRRLARRIVGALASGQAEA